jgi:hypothetical protein
MTGSFFIEVEYPDGTIKYKGAQTGGGPCTPEQLVKHYEDVNAFPGAKSVTVYPSDAPVAKTVIEALLKRNAASEKMKKMAKVVPTTPKIKLGERIKLKLPEPPEEPTPGTAEALVEERSKPEIGATAAHTHKKQS